MRRSLVIFAVGVVVVLTLRHGFFGPSATRVTPEQAKQAFARVGLSHPDVQSKPQGVIFDYGSPPHLVSVSVFTGATPRVIFGHLKGMRVTRWANVMVYYNKTETPAVKRASKILGDHTWVSSIPR
jgi:hypothetical protein